MTCKKQQQLLLQPRARFEPGVHLLITSQISYSLVLLSANIDDVKRLAMQFVPEPLAEQIASFLTKATRLNSRPISSDNIRSGLAKLSYVDWRDTEQRGILDISEEGKHRNHISVKRGRDIPPKVASTSEPPKAVFVDTKKNFEYDYVLKQWNLIKPNFEWQKGANYDIAVLTNEGPSFDSTSAYATEETIKSKTTADMGKKHVKTVKTPHSKVEDRKLIRAPFYPIHTAHKSDKDVQKPPTRDYPNGKLRQAKKETYLNAQVHKPTKEKTYKIMMKEINRPTREKTYMNAIKEIRNPGRERPHSNVFKETHKPVREKPYTKAGKETRKPTKEEHYLNVIKEFLKPSKEHVRYRDDGKPTEVDINFKVQKQSKSDTKEQSKENVVDSDSDDDTDINKIEENSSDSDRVKETTKAIDATKFIKNERAKTVKLQSEKSIYTKDVVATSGPVELLRASVNFIPTSEENSLNEENKKYFKQYDTYPRTDLRRHLEENPGGDMKPLNEETTTTTYRSEDTTGSEVREVNSVGTESPAKSAEDKKTKPSWYDGATVYNSEPTEQFSEDDTTEKSK